MNWGSYRGPAKQQVATRVSKIDHALGCHVWMFQKKHWFLAAQNCCLVDMQLFVIFSFQHYSTCFKHLYLYLGWCSPVTFVSVKGVETTNQPNIYKFVQKTDPKITDLQTDKTQIMRWTFKVTHEFNQFNPKKWSSTCGLRLWFGLFTSEVLGWLVNDGHQGLRQFTVNLSASKPRAYRDRNSIEFFFSWWLSAVWD